MVLMTKPQVGEEWKHGRQNECYLKEPSSSGSHAESIYKHHPIMQFGAAD